MGSGIFLQVKRLGGGDVHPLLFPLKLNKE
jgi:hypothetical protein